MMTELLLASIAIVLLTCANAEYDVKKYCPLVQPGTKLASLDSCQNYYTCVNDEMVVKSSCPANFVFDKDAQSCVAESESNCYYGLANPCYNKHNQFTYCSNGCNWYNYCVNGEIAGNGTCLVGQRFYAANSSCIYGDCDNKNDVDVCDIMPEGVFFGDSDNCRTWHKCFRMNQETGQCEGSLVFDVNSGYCLKNEGNICQRTNNVIKGEASGPPEEPCTSTSQVVADLNVCSLYYACEVVTQIPVVKYQWVAKSCKTQYYDVISKTCTGTLTARVSPDCNRCELKTGYYRTYWVNAVDPTCTQYITCSNGQKIGAGARSCKQGTFFDESAQACVGAEERQIQYVANNGVCQDYTCDELRQCSMASGEASIQPPTDTSAQTPKETSAQTIKDTSTVTEASTTTTVRTPENATNETLPEE